MSGVQQFLGSGLSNSAALPFFIGFRASTPKGLPLPLTRPHKEHFSGFEATERLSALSLRVPGTTVDDINPALPIIRNIP